MQCDECSLFTLQCEVFWSSYWILVWVRTTRESRPPSAPTGSRGSTACQSHVINTSCVAPAAPRTNSSQPLLLSATTATLTLSLHPRSTDQLVLEPVQHDRCACAMYAADCIW